MANVNVSRTVPVNAPPDTVWSYIVRPERIVGCLPGATLVSSSEDGRRHEGTVSVAVGPLAVAYKGTAEFVEVDDAARRLRVEAKGREKTGAGMVSMTMTAEVAPRDGGSEVRVDAAVQLAGRIVAFGRGMVDAVMEEVLDEFATCLSARLEGEVPQGGAAEDGVAEGGEAEAGATAGSVASRAAGPANSIAAGGPAGVPASPPPARPAKPVGLVGLLLRALRTRLRRLFGGR